MKTSRPRRDAQTPSRFSAAMLSAASDPLRFRDMLAEWDAAFEEIQADQDTIDSTVEQALLVMAKAEDAETVGPKTKRLIGRFSHPVLIARADGRIVAMNEAAMGRLNPDIGDSIDAIGYVLDHATPIADLISNLLGHRNAKAELILRKAYHETTDRAATLAVLPSADGPDAKTAMIFLIDPVSRQEVQTLMAQAYDLTEAETGVLLGFLEGLALKEIAALRDRSLATVRTQFHALMAKTGARTQAELMRNALALSQFLTEAGDVTALRQHPDRKRFDLLCPGGRSVEVILAGDLNGALVVLLGVTSTLGFPADVEADLKTAGLCLATVNRPGFGDTDPTDLPVDEVIASDIKGLMGQFGASTIHLLGINASIPVSLRVAHHLAGKVHALTGLCCFAPPPYQTRAKNAQSWSSVMGQAVRKSNKLSRFVARLGVRAWKSLGSRRFVSLQLQGNPNDVAAATQPEQLAEFDAALHSAFAQGLDVTIADFEALSEDWSRYLEDSPVPLHLIHGEHDPVCPISQIEAFAADFPKQINLTRCEGGGVMLFHSHRELLLDHFRTANPD